MKILVVDNSSLTPAGDALCCDNKTGSFVSELKALGNDVTMYGQVVETERNLHKYNLADHGVATFGVQRSKNKVVSYLRLYAYSIKAILDSDFVYIFLPSALRYMSLICFVCRKPYGVYIRGEKGVSSRSSKWIYRASKVVFTVTDHFTELVNKFTSQNCAHTVRPMIPFSEEDLVLGRKYDVNIKMSILFLGRVDRNKGLSELLYAIKVLKDRKYSFGLLLVGDGAYLPEVRNLVESLDIGDYVSIEGGVLDPDKVKSYYLNADLYVLPTYHEGFPRTLYEAMIFGAPIVTTFVGGIPGLMKDKFNCLEIKPKSVNSIVQGLEYAINNYEEMAVYAGRAFDTVLPIVSSSRLTHAQHLNSLIS